MDKKAKISENLMCMFPKMSRVNEVIRRKSVKDAIWSVFEFDPSCEFPDIGEDLLYGGVSDVVDNPGIKTVYVSDLDPLGYSCYFKLLASRQKRPIKMYDEKAAASFRPDTD